MKLYIVLVFVLTGSTFLPYFSFADECLSLGPPQVVEEVEDLDRYHLLVMWENLPIGILQNRTIPASDDLEAYQNSVDVAINADPYFLLHRYRALGTDPSDLHNIEQIAAGKAGGIREIHCLEALLLEFQIKRTPQMLTAPTEFLAYYLEQSGRLRVYLLTNDSLGVGGISVLSHEIEKDLSAGWKVIGNLHNHSFFLDDLDADKPQGVLAPSGSDMMVLNAHAASIGLPVATITNGFHTLEIEAESFPTFRVRK